MQVFFRGDGTLVIGVMTKNQFLTACASERPLDGKWHHIAVSFAVARRHFGQNQVTVFIDGLQVLSVAIKFPSFSDVS